MSTAKVAIKAKYEFKATNRHPPVYICEKRARHTQRVFFMHGLGAADRQRFLRPSARCTGFNSSHRVYAAAGLIARSITQYPCAS
jgi:predicted esterase